MGKHWARQQVKRNELVDVVDQALVWVNSHRQATGLSAAAMVLITLAGGSLLYHRHSLQAAAWEQLSMAQGLAFRGDPDKALEQIKKIVSDDSRANASGFGLLFAGDMLYPRAQYKESMEYYSKLLERGKPVALMPLALGGLGMAQEASEGFEQAASTNKRFLETYPDHFLAPQVHSSLARCLEALGKAAQAKAAYQKIALQYPETPWALGAKNHYLQFNNTK